MGDAIDPIKFEFATALGNLSNQQAHNSQNEMALETATRAVACFKEDEQLASSVATSQFAECLYTLAMRQKESGLPPKALLTITECLRIFQGRQMDEEINEEDKETAETLGRYRELQKELQGFLSK